MHGSGHSHSCAEGSVSSSCVSSVPSIASITPKVARVVIFVQLIDWILLIKNAYMVLTDRQTVAVRRVKNAPTMPAGLPASVRRYATID